uniref:Putative secreted protein n=1 Tax=Anopheles darlingi TaxID=43151 RepID=A0A2M4D3K6_ANODA
MRFRSIGFCSLCTRHPLGAHAVKTLSHHQAANTLGSARSSESEGKSWSWSWLWRHAGFQTRAQTEVLSRIVTIQV